MLRVKPHKAPVFIGFLKCCGSKKSVLRVKTSKIVNVYGGCCGVAGPEGGQGRAALALK
jgi:hypothetical protein